MSGDPSDAEIEERLRAVPDSRWHELWAAASAVEEQPSADRVRWAGGETKPGGAMQLPYPVYSDAVERLRAALAGIDAVVPFDWGTWHAAHPYHGPEALDDAPVADAVRMITTIVRAERFNEGSIGAAIDEGTMASVIKRLRRWCQEEAT